MSVKEQWVFGNQCLEVVNSHIYLVFVFSTFDVTNEDHLIRARHGTFEITKTLRKLGCSSPSLFFKTSWGTDSCPLFSMALNCGESRPVIQSKKFIYKAVSCFSMYRPPPPIPHPQCHGVRRTGKSPSVYTSCGSMSAILVPSTTTAFMPLFQKSIRYFIWTTRKK